MHMKCFSALFVVIFGETDNFIHSSVMNKFFVCLQVCCLQYFDNHSPNCCPCWQGKSYLLKQLFGLILKLYRVELSARSLNKRRPGWKKLQIFLPEMSLILVIYIEYEYLHLIN